jgi:DNA modification methylase
MNATIHATDALTLMRGMVARDEHVALVLGSPEYPYKGSRYIDGVKTKWDYRAWPAMMIEIVRWSLEIAPVAMFVVNDSVVDGCFVPAIAKLQVLAYEHGFVAERPLVWSKNAPPNRGESWWGNNHETILAFKRSDGDAPVFNWEAIATPRKFAPGGDFRQRGSNGERRTRATDTGTMARPRDVVEVAEPVGVSPSALATLLGVAKSVKAFFQADFENLAAAIEHAEEIVGGVECSDVLRATVGGGHLGHKLAHENEAPYPERLIEPIVKALTNPGDTVFDPFTGSGTTGAVALKLDRNFVGCDVRFEQCKIAVARWMDECPGHDVLIGGVSVYDGGAQHVLDILDKIEAEDAATLSKGDE